MGRDLAGSCAWSLATGMKRSERNRGKVVLRATRGDNSFDIGIVYAGARQCVKHEWVEYLKDMTSVFRAFLFALFAAATASYNGVSSLSAQRKVGASSRWGRHGFDGIACGREACRGVDTRNRSQNYKCRTSIRACCLIIK